MSNIKGITHEGLRDAVISMQIDGESAAYYGQFALYFNFIEDHKLPAAAGVTVIDGNITFVYNSIKIDEHVKEFGDMFLTFLVIHECQHILLNHILRGEGMKHSIANIAQDMLINTQIQKDFGISYPPFYYFDRDYADLEYKHDDYKGLPIFEPLYNHILDNAPEDFDDGKGEGGEGEGGEGNGQGTPGQGQGKGGQPKDGKGNGKGRLVDDHEAMQEFLENMTGADKSKLDSMVMEIHDTLKARGYGVSGGVETMFNMKKEKPVVNVFKKILGNGKIKSGTYRKMSRRNPKLKGKRKENKDVNLIVDTSGSIYSELSEIMPQLVGNFNVYCVQIDTSVKFAGHVKNFKDWKNVPITGGGGTTLQPAIDKLIEERRGHIQTIFASDYYCEELDFAGIGGEVAFVKTQGATEPKFRNCAKHKIFDTRPRD
jgi:predicted metal-dependent peptidase